MILRKYKWHLLIVAFLLLLLVEPFQQAQQSKTPAFTDMMSTEEFRRCGLSKLTPKELDALNDWMLETFVKLNLKMPESEGELTLYENDDTPAAYIAMDEDFTIYLWSGTPVAYLSEGSIYGFNGKHLGWFYKGAVYDHKGKVVGITKTKAIFSTKNAPAKGTKESTPLKSFKEFEPFKPFFGISKSELPLKVFLAGGSITPSTVVGEVIESRIEGEFEGWDGETIFKLDNGQIWQQASYAYTYHYAYRPKVVIYKTAGGWTEMKVEGVDKTISVKRLK